VILLPQLPIIPALERLRQEDTELRGQPETHRETMPGREGRREKQQ
jgi:hypothetical protein